MDKTLIIIAFLIFVYYVLTREIPKKHYSKYKSRKYSHPTPKPTPEVKPAKTPSNFNYKNYKPKWVFTQNEKNAYWAIKEVTDELGLVLLAKVRLFDLVEPKKGVHIVYQHKIQAKHVDFVVCDSRLVARVIIELDDSSHDRSDRMKRDAFVDEVLWNTGYKIIRARGINKQQLREILQQYSVKQTATE